MRNLIGVFTDKEAANVAFLNLLKAGYKNQDISIIMKEDQFLGKEKGQKGGIASSTLKSSILSGGLIGGIAGVLVGLSAIFVPGLGAVLIAGPLASFLGITGVSAVTISGAVTGVLAGGLAAGLVEIGLEKDAANFYERLVKRGGIMIYVPVSDKNSAEDIKQIFIENGGNYIKELVVNIKNTSKKRGQAE